MRPEVRNQVVLRWGLLTVAVATVILAAISLMNSRESGEPEAEADAGAAFFDYGGLRFDVPEGFVVQDVDGRLDGELACPQAVGFVFAGIPVSPDAVYTTATCDVAGEETIIRVAPSNESWPFADPSYERGTVNGIELVWVGDDTVVTVEPTLWISVYGPRAEEHLASLVENLRRSPSGEDLVPPTSAKAVTTVSDRLADQLTCDTRERVTTYARGGQSPVLGRQLEAPVDCLADGDGYRLLVLRDQGAVESAVEYYADVYLVVGDGWVVTAMNRGVAELAQSRVGGQIRPPSGECCHPPTSDFLPG